MFLAAVLSPCGVAYPWGGANHKLVNASAVGYLPSSMTGDGSGNNFLDKKTYLRTHSTDPDWQKSYDGAESDRHFCDIDAKLSTYPAPFTTVPRDYAAYLSVFGISRGVIQWEGIRDHYDRLVDLMRARNWFAAYQCAAELGHYVADATCPLHSTVYYYGYGTGDSRNIGIHERYEDMAATYIIALPTPTPASPTYVSDRVECGFQLIAGGNSLVAALLDADIEAQIAAGGTTDPYPEELYDRVGADAQAQLVLGARRLADLWYSAWLDAGSPSLTPGGIKFNFQPLSKTIPSGGWGVAPEYTYGPFGAFGW
jgi:hypothetical protein